MSTSTDSDYAELSDKTVECSAVAVYVMNMVYFMHNS